MHLQRCFQTLADRRFYADIGDPWCFLEPAPAYTDRINALQGGTNAMKRDVRRRRVKLPTQFLPSNTRPANSKGLPNSCAASSKSASARAARIRVLLTRSPPTQWAGLASIAKFIC